MKLIFAQGNPSQEYKDTRHNVGFMVLDEFAAQYKISFALKSKFLAEVAELNVDGEKVILVKPTTYYNETGRSARFLVDFYKLNPADDLLVIHDDLALPFGTIRIRKKGSDAGNNGIKSLNSHIGPDYTRIRIGIYNALRDDIDDAAFVLSRFNENERKVLENTMIPQTTNLLASFIAGTLDKTSYKTNP